MTAKAEQDDIAAIAATYHAWRGDATGAYADVPGFCASVTLAQIKEAGYVLSPPVKKLCVPAFLAGVPTPTPTAQPTPTPTPVVTSTPTPVVTPTPPYGSASRAFVKPVGSLLQ